MSQASILKLPPECFFKIFKYIKNYCENERPFETDRIKYAELISFAACCEWFSDMLNEWNAHLFFRLMEFVFFYDTIIEINFERIYTRLKNTSAKDKKTYWSSLCQGIKNHTSYDVSLHYAPESFHSDHLEVFNTLIESLQYKPNLKELRIDVRGYSLEGLGRIDSLEKLYLNIRMDIDDLIEICRQNKNLRMLSFMNNETGGKRLAAIAPHCEQLEYLKFKMRPDCDASEYRPLAKIPRLDTLRIEGINEKGTLQPLLVELSGKILEDLSIYDAPLDHNETQAMAEIESLTSVRCRFDDPQSIGLLSKLTNLDRLGILSRHDFGELSQQVLRILVESKMLRSIHLVNASISYSSSGELTLNFKEKIANASDCSTLSTLTGLSSMPIPNGLRNAPLLTYLILENITAEETAVVSKIESLKRLECGFVETQNAELLAQLPVLEELIITSVPSSPGPLQGLLAALASRQSQTLRYLRLEEPITSGEAKELARLRSLRTLECELADPLDIQLLAQLTELEKLHLSGNEMFGKISPGVLAIVKCCKKLAEINLKCNQNISDRIDMKSSEILVEMFEACQDKICIRLNNMDVSLHRKSLKLNFEISFFEQNNLAIESLARLESVNHLEIKGYVAPGSLRKFFAALAIRTKHYLQSLSIDHGLIDFNDTTELAKITSLTSFTGALSDVRSFQHLHHLSDFQVVEEGSGGRIIMFDKCTGKLTITSFNLMKDLANGMGLTSLAILQNLRCVTISGLFEVGSMRQFFGALATLQGKTPQELRVESPYEMSSEELREVSRIKSLRTLTCGLSHFGDMEIEQLAQLPQLAVLIVESHRAGSLMNLLGSIAARECPTLEHLVVTDESLTAQEVTAVSTISSLTGLECAFSSTLGLHVLSHRNSIEHLGITTRSGEASLVDVLTAFAFIDESKIEHLIIDGPAVDQESDTVLNLILRIPRLKFLKLPIADTQSIEGLAESLLLEELTISTTGSMGSLVGFFRALSLKASTKLKNLVLENTSIGLEEAHHLVQVGSIRSLKCGFEDDECISLLAKLTNLENLKITSDHAFTNISGHLLGIFRECRTLKSINLGYIYCLLYQGFLIDALDILKSVRDPSTQGPLELRICQTPTSGDEIHQMSALGQTYLIVQKEDYVFRKR